MEVNALTEIDEKTAPQYNQVKPILSVPIVGMLLQKNYSQADIARYFNISNQAVNQFIKRNTEALSPFTDFENILSATIKAKGFKIISSIDDTDIKKASLQQKVISGATLIDKFRLLDGKSTEIHANFDIAADINEMINQLKSIK